MESILQNRNGFSGEPEGRAAVFDLPSAGAHDDFATIRHMIEAGDAAFAFSAGIDRSKLASDPKSLFALARAVEAMGEQASHVSETTRVELPWVPWAKLVELPKRIADDSSQIDVDLIWKVLTEELPEIVEDLKEYLDSQCPRD